MPYRLRRSFHAPSALALFAIALLSTLPAAAQVIDVVENTLIRSNGTRPIGQSPTWVSYDDCIEDDILTLSVNLQGFSGFNLEVWATTSGSCQELSTREGSAAACWLVARQTPSISQQSVSIRARDIVAQNKNNGSTTGWGPGTGKLESCESKQENTAVSLYFMLVDNGHNVQGTSEPYASGIDLIGPDPPTDLSAGIGEEQLIVKWGRSSTATDRRGYRVYCDPPRGGATAPASSPMAVDGGADADIDAASDAATTTDAGTALPDASPSDAGAESGTGGAPAANPDCPSALVPGERPDEAYFCGSTSSQVATRVEAEGLSNGVLYAVAVAGVDQVGNTGVLSETVCGTPQIVDDFFELYRRAGGKAGGGFCQVSGEPATGFLALLAAALGALGWRRMRRTR
jgi:uncharacterized protein (TIGR03382 family)